MAIRQIGSIDGHTPEMQCDSCDVIFNVVWNRNPVYDAPEFCPFCGDEADYEYERQEPDHGAD